MKNFKQIKLAGAVGSWGKTGREVERTRAGEAGGMLAPLPSLLACASLRAAADGGINHSFGFSVSLPDSTGLVGAYGDDDKGVRFGPANVYCNLDTTGGAP